MKEKEERPSLHAYLNQITRIKEKKLFASFCGAMLHMLQQTGKISKVGIELRIVWMAKHPTVH